MTGINRKELTEALATQTAEAERIASTFKVDEKGRFAIGTDQAAGYRTAVANAKEIKSLLDSHDEVGSLRSYLDAPEGTPAAASGFSGGGAEYKSIGDMFVENEGVRKVAGSLDNWQGGRVSARMEGKSIFNLSGGTATVPGLGTAQHLQLAEQSKRKFHVRDLFPKSKTGAAVLYGVRETGWVNNAEAVAQSTAGVAGAKAKKSQLNFTSVMYPVAEVAHTINVHKNILADEPRLRTFLNTRMVEGVKYAEDEDLLFGAGGAEKITGIANTPGIQAYAGLVTDKQSVQVRRAITKALLAEYDPTGLVISPEMWEQIEVEEDDNGAFRVAVAVAVGAEKRVWRLNVVETTAMSDEQYLLGAFGMGAQLHDREVVSVSISSDNGTNFEDGLVTVRADERVALEVPRPESFVLGTWTP